MKKWNSIFENKEKLKESKEGTDIYKMLGNALNIIKKSGLSNVTDQERDSIKDRINELLKSFKTFK